MNEAAGSSTATISRKIFSSRAERRWCSKGKKKQRTNSLTSPGLGEDLILRKINWKLKHLDNRWRRRKLRPGPKSTTEAKGKPSLTWGKKAESLKPVKKRGSCKISAHRWKKRFQGNRRPRGMERRQTEDRMWRVHPVSSCYPNPVY